MNEKKWSNGTGRIKWTEKKEIRNKTGKNELSENEQVKKKKKSESEEPKQKTIKDDLKSIKECYYTTEMFIIGEKRKQNKNGKMTLPTWKRRRESRGRRRNKERGSKEEDRGHKGEEKDHQHPIQVSIL